MKQFLNLRQCVGLLGRGSAHRKVATYHKHTIHTGIHALSGIRPHDPSVRAGEDTYILGRAATMIGVEQLIKLLSVLLHQNLTFINTTSSQFARQLRS
jgi:hypothetical protein